MVEVIAMGMDLAKLRRLVSLDESDPLSRFALGKKLFETAEQDEAGKAALEEAAGHLRFAHQKSPAHLATYHILAQVLIRLGLNDEARDVLGQGITRVADVGEGMGRDLGPAMEALLAGIH